MSTDRVGDRPLFKALRFICVPNEGHSVLSLILVGDVWYQFLLKGHLAGR